MNARPEFSRPTPASGTVTTLDNSYDLFDLARWKPISSDRLLDELAFIHSSTGRRTMTMDTLEMPDGRIRTAYVTRVIHLPSNREHDEPYLLLQWDPADARSRPTVFVRTDVNLPDEDDAE